MAFSFQWNTRFSPQLAVNERALPFNVHATTDLRIAQPFREGDLISCQGRLISMQQIKPGVLTTSRYSLINGRAEKIAELDMGGITRGASLQGPDIAIEPAADIPAFSGKRKLLWEASVYIAPQAAQIYTECAQIYNPIHTERKVATAAGLPDIILHGSATQAISMSQIINRCLDGNPARVLRYVGQLRALVLMDSNIRIRCLGIEHRQTDQLILFEVLNAEGEKAVANGLVVASLAG
jgi:acyl dehydratase